MRLVLDTNVLLSALMSSASTSAQIVALWRRRSFDLLNTAEPIDEITRVTRYPKLRARLIPQQQRLQRKSPAAAELEFN